MTKMTSEMYEIAYEECKKAYVVSKNDFDKIKKSDAMDIMEKAGWNKTSTMMTFPGYKNLMNGTLYDISMSSLQTKIFLGNILRDYDRDIQKKL